MCVRVSVFTGLFIIPHRDKSVRTAHMHQEKMKEQGVVERIRNAMQHSDASVLTLQWGQVCIWSSC